MFFKLNHMIELLENKNKGREIRFQENEQVSRSKRTFSAVPFRVGIKVVQLLYISRYANLAQDGLGWHPLAVPLGSLHSGKGDGLDLDRLPLVRFLRESLQVAALGSPLSRRRNWISRSLSGIQARLFTCI